MDVAPALFQAIVVLVSVIIGYAMGLANRRNDT